MKSKDESSNRKSFKKYATGRLPKILKELSFLMTFTIIVLAARASIADHYVVPTGSMEPTVHVGDRLIVNKLAYGLRVPLTNKYVLAADEPCVGDVVVLDSPRDDVVLLKRLVAGPGDVVTVRNGILTLNDEEMPVYISRDELIEDIAGVRHRVCLTWGGGPEFGPTTLPPGKYLVMGDNRGQSLDGRMFGFVSREAILGRAVGVFFSKSRPTWNPL